MAVLKHIWVRLGAVVLSVGIIPLVPPYGLANDGAKTAGSNLCEKADTLFALKLYKLARIEYGKIATNAAVNPICANHGLAKIAVLEKQAEQQYLVGLASAKTEQFDTAIKNYLTALSIDPELQDAESALKSALDYYQIASVEALVQQGLYPQALARLQDIQTGHNSPTTIPEHLQFLHETPISQWLEFRRTNHRWRLWLEMGIVLLIAIIILPVVCLVIRWRLWPWLKELFLLHLKIHSFEDGPTDELKVGKGVTSLVQEVLSNSDDQLLESHHLDLVVDSIESFQIPSELVGLAPPIAILNDVLAWVAPPNILSVSGTIQYSTTKGTGLTIVLTENRTRKILQAHTFWKDKIDDDYLLLSSKVAYWLIQAATNYQRHESFYESNGRSTVLGISATNL